MVEDEEFTRTLVAEGLRSAGFTVSSASGVSAALASHQSAQLAVGGSVSLPDSVVYVTKSSINSMSDILNADEFTLNSSEDVGPLLLDDETGHVLVTALQVYLSDLRQGGSPSAAAVRERVMKLLDEAFMDLQGIINRQPEVAATVQDVVRREQDQSRGLLRITCNFPPTVEELLLGAPELSALVGECVSEAVTNASCQGTAVELD